MDKMKAAPHQRGNHTRLHLVSNPGRAIIRRNQIPQRYGVPLSSWDRGVREGIYPAGFKLGPAPIRAVGWWQDELDEFFQNLAQASE